MTRATVYPRRDTVVRVDGVDVAILKVGALVPLDPPTATQTHKRVITTDDLVKVARDVVALLEQNGITAVTVEHNPGKGAYAEDARRIETAITEACLLVGISPETVEGKATKPSETRVEPSPATVEAALVPTLGGPKAHAAVATSGALAAELAAPPTGPRVAGVDPGSGDLAVCVAEPGAPLRFVEARTYDVRAVTDDKLPAWLHDVTAWLRSLGVARVVLEKVTGVYGHGALVHAAKATAIANTQRILGVLVGWLLAESFDVDMVTESTWHAAAVPGRRTKRQRVGDLLPALETAYGGTWPTKSNEHVRDAGGIILADIMPKKKKTSGPRSKVKGPHKSHVKARAARDAKRAASGCTCRGRSSHAKACPAYVAKVSA